MITNTKLRACTLPRKFLSFCLASIGVGIIFWFYFTHFGRARHQAPPIEIPNTNQSASKNLYDIIADRFRTAPINESNFKDRFGELGRRVQVLTSWFQQTQANSRVGSQATIAANHNLYLLAENLTLSHFPFLRNPRSPNDVAPVDSLRRTYVAGSKGIVIPVGVKTLRFAIHLILNIREVLGTRLPMHIVFAGDDDLPSYARDKLRRTEPDIEFIDILTVFDDSVMGLQRDWAIKPFAVLASTFETVILLDADTVFFQKPEVLLDLPEYKKTGAYFFHDRLLWKGGFKDRHDWWKRELGDQAPSETLRNSLVWREDYAEEADSGVVVLDKGRLPLFMGLLHVCWQNTRAVREAVTYKMTYGDKESWWFGLELSGVPYSFEQHYGAVLGLFNKEGDNRSVCSFSIAHLYERDKVIWLFWLNGSLLRNKIASKTEYLGDADYFREDQQYYFMYDGTWDKGKTKSDMSCMKGEANQIQILDAEVQHHMLKLSVELAKKADEEYSLL